NQTGDGMKKGKRSKHRSSKKTRSAQRKQSKPRGMNNSLRRREWVGGRVLAPVFVGPDEPYRPMLELWVADGYIVHSELYDPNRPIAPVSEDLRQKLLDPLSGGSPQRLRLNDPHWAAEVRRALPGFDV